MYCHRGNCYSESEQYQQKLNFCHSGNSDTVMYCHWRGNCYSESEQYQQKLNFATAATVIPVIYCHSSNEIIVPSILLFSFVLDKNISFTNLSYLSLTKQNWQFLELNLEQQDQGLHLLLCFIHQNIQNSFFFPKIFHSY